MVRNDAPQPRDRPACGHARQLSRREALYFLGSILLACPAALGACSNPTDDAQSVRDAVDSELTKLTTLPASDLLGGSVGEIEHLGISGEDFLGALLDGCSWSLRDVSVEGASATVWVDLTCRSLSSALSALKDAYTSQTLSDGGHPDESSLYVTAGKALIDCIHATTPGVRSTQVSLCKKDGSWSVDDAGNTSLSDLLLGS